MPREKLQLEIKIDGVTYNGHREIWKSKGLKRQLVFFGHLSEQDQDAYDNYREQLMLVMAESILRSLIVKSNSLAF